MKTNRTLPEFLVTLLCGLLVCGSAEAKKKERTRYFELQPMVGYSFIDLSGLSKDKLFDSLPEDPEALRQEAESATASSVAQRARVNVKGHGPSVGAAAQLKLWFIVLGARYSFTQAQDFALHVVGGDLGLRFGTKHASMYGRIGAGFAQIGGFPEALKTQGLAASISGGLEFHLSPAFSLGFGADGDLLLMTQEFDAAANFSSGSADEEDLASLDGSAVGYQLRPQLHFIWHI